MHRRTFLRSMAASSMALGLPALAACGDDEEEPAAPTAGTGSPAAVTGATIEAGPGSEDLPRSSRPLRVATNVFPVAVDPDVGFTSFSLMGVGVAEALMRVLPDMSLEPWLAEKLEQVDDVTWRATIRSDATFWDGSPVDAAAVKASFERTLEKLPGSVSFAFPEGTEFRADGRALDIVTPSPIGAMPANLAVFYLGVKKLSPDGSILMTGPYRLEDFVEQQSATLVAYEDHRSGPARTPRIELNRVTDVNTRLLSLQAGDVDLAFALLPSQLPQLQSANLKVESFLFGRLNGIILNNTRPPLDDVAVRRAISLAIDRDELVVGVLEGQGKPAYGIATAEWGIEAAVDTQRFDRKEANTVLDAAGWTRDGDGPRQKDGRPLAFTLGFYKSRPELEPFAVVVADHLRQAGIEVSLAEELDVNAAVAGNTFDAMMYSYTVAPSGDLNRGLAQLFIPGPTNQDRYSNPEVNRLYDQYNQASDPAKRTELVQAIQELIGDDVPFVYLAYPNQIVAMLDRVTGYVPHLLENYQLDERIYIEG